MSSLPTTYITPEEYLERERRAEFKSEYYDGQIFAMSGASSRHAWIVNSLSGLLWQQLEDGPCWVATNDLRLRVTLVGIYTYPDLLVICGEPQFADDQKDTVLNFVVLIEVLLKSTRDYDLGKNSASIARCPRWRNT
jgi:Uma2 family endonuclease